MSNRLGVIKGSVLSLSLVVLAGCDPDSLPPSDGGSGSAADAGSTVDAGSPVDAGSSIDAGPGLPNDGGSALDAGSVRDSGAAADSGSSFDAGAPVDAGASFDAGRPTDGGFGYALPAPGTSLVLGSSIAQSIRPSSHTEGAWQYSLFDSYGGGVFVPSFSEAGAYVLAGTGGHNSPEFTGAAAFDFTIGAWALLSDASGSPARSAPFHVSETNGSPEYELALSGTTPNAVPSPPHPYMNLLALPPSLGGGPKGSVVYVVQGAQCSESVASNRSHRFDLDTRTWSRFSSNSLSSVVTGHAVAFESPSVFDPTAKRFWQLPNAIHDTTHIGYLDLTQTTPEWQVSASWSFPPTWEGTNSAWVDDARRLILLQSSQRLIALDLTNLSSGPHELTIAGALPTALNRWVLYPADGSFYSKGNTGNVINRLTPPASSPLTGTWTYSTFTPVGATLEDISVGGQTSGARHYTRFFYVPAIGCFAWIASSTSPVVLIKPP